ncbi:MAG: TonB-dependent receptor [Gammaproteobacteria bacterium]|nr:TonB-dependent receptor [Gammaproteobacteria bacterium]
MRSDRNRAAGALLGMTMAMSIVLQPVAAQKLEEIVVTARRQGEEKLMETPLAITAFDANAIESKGISNLQDVANLTPGLSFFNPLGEALPTPVIRGVVPQDIFGENSAAIFVDGVYVAGREGLNFSQLDIERIEVLKGPQSSVYGRNAFSGAINYVTKPPSDEFEAKAEATGGNRGKQKILGEVSGPIFSDRLTGRFSAMYDEWDGSYDNTLAPENDIGGYRYRSFQGKLRWVPVDTLDITLSIYRSNDEIDDAATGAVLANCEDQVNQTSANAAASPGTRWLNWCGQIPKLEDLPDPLDPAQFPLGIPQPHMLTRDSMPKDAQALGQDRNLTRGNLNIAWDTDYGVLSSLTGYSFMKESAIYDFNRITGHGTPLVYCFPSTNFEPPTCDSPLSWSRIPMGVLDPEPGPRVEEWSQELRFTGPRDQRLRWQVGGYYFHSVLEDRQGNPALSPSTPLPPGFNYGPGGSNAIGPVAMPTSLAIGTYVFAASLLPNGGLDPLNRPFVENNNKSWSLFGSLDFDVTDKLQARTELRYTNDHKYAYGFNHSRCVSPTAGSAYPLATDLPPECGDELFDLRDVAPVGYQTWVKDVNGIYQLVDIPGVEKGSARFDNITGRVGLDYKLDSGWMVYGSIAYGEKPGGINVLAAKEVIDPSGGVRPSTIFNDFDPEKITAYELGLKGYTSDRRIRLDMAVFYNDWQDIVLRQLTMTDPVTGLQFRQPQGLNVNSGDARVFGWEFTADLGFTESLTGRVTVAYTDSQVKNGRLDTLALFPSFYTAEPSCAPAAIQALPVNQQDAKATACRGISGSIAGNTQMRQPEWTASASLDYRHQLAGDWDLMSSLTANYIDQVFIGNDNQGWVPSRTNVNFNIGVASPRYTLTFWVRNLLDNDDPLSAYRDIFWTNDSDLYATVPPGTGTIRDVSTFDDFPPMRMTISYPSLRTFGLDARMRFGGAEK